MKWTVIILFMFLLATSAWAGTLRDDFSDRNFEGWRETWMKENQTTWKVESGVLTGENPSGWSAFLIIGDETWQDYEVECDTQIIAIRNSIPSVGIGLRHSGQVGAASQTIFLGLVASNVFPWPGACANYLANNNAFLKKTKVMPVEVGKWYHLKVRVQGDYFEFEVDGNQVIAIHDKTLASGAVGLEAHAAVAQYDNVIIRGDNVPDINLSVNPKGKLTDTWVHLKQIG